MKAKYTIAFFLLLVIFRGFSQNNSTIQVQSAAVPLAAPPIDGGGNTYPWNRDLDGDGYGNPDIQIEATTQPAGYVSNNSDCDDSNPNIYPGAIEKCDGVDNNCNGLIDESLAPSQPDSPTIVSNCGSTVLTRGTPPSGITWYWQSSISGTSTTNSSTSISRTSGTIYYLRGRNNSTECWGTARSVNYTVNNSSLWYSDNDGDGFGDPNSSTTSCSQPTGYVSNNLDECPDYAGTNNGCSSSVLSLSNENYIYTIIPTEPTTNVSSLIDNEIIESVQYFDGLGRPMQSIGIRAGGAQQDIVTHIGYDDFGRQDKDYLPYAVEPDNSNYGGIHQTGADMLTIDFYNKTKYENTLNPYSEKELEASPLSRVLKQAAPGADWALGMNNEIEFEYETNTSVDNNVRIFGVTLSFANNTYTPTLVGGSTNYDTGELYKTVTKDENHSSGLDHTTEEFKDKQGRVILKRTYENSVRHDTYYVYDDYGNLTYVLPPKIDASINNLSNIISRLNDLGYQYVYDNRNRLVEKRIPGKGLEYIVYNKLDQPIMTQDANQREPSTNEWLFTKYDAFGRVAYTGLVTGNFIRTDLQTSANNTILQYVTKSDSYTSLGGAALYYSNNGSVYPIGSISKIYTINYYDNYTFDGFANMPSTFDGQNVINYNNSSSTQKLTKGLTTGSKVRVLDTNDWITTYTGYDAKGRPIYVKSINDYLGTTDVVKSTLDFTGAIDKTVTEHEKGNSSVDTENLYTYDHMGRLTKQTQELNNTNVLEVIVENNYDELGQLESKGVGGKMTQGRLQNIGYTYNIRGWLKEINNPASLGDDLFGFKINYNTQDHGGTQLYNGNIAETEWKTANTDNGLKWYRYEYDALNRIESGIANSSNYNLTNIDYDKNGNIEYLERRGHTNLAGTSFGVMDNLVYTYETNSNKLKKVLDNGNDTYGFKDGSNITTEYTYDANGNMLRDYNKGIISNIIYNHLNLPTSVSLSGGNISYIYDATGIKLKKIVSTGATTEYAGNYVYEDTGSGSSLKFFNHPEGYVEPNGSGGFDYVYQYKDHLGNVRLSYKDLNGDYKELLNDTFDQGIGNWRANGSLSNSNGELKVTSIGQYYGASILLGDDFSPGQQIKIKLHLDKGTTDIVRRYIFETDDAGHTLGYYQVDYDIDSGNDEFIHTVVAGTKVNLKIDKSQNSSDVGVTTYFYLDNVQATLGDLEILEENNYYPFGLKHKGYNNVVNGIDHPYGFGGKEEQNELGLGWIDITARNYSPELGRWMNLDPLAEKMRRHSPYNYAFDNPIYFIDYDGMMPSGGGKDYIFSSSQTGNVDPVKTSFYRTPYHKRGKSGKSYHSHTLPSSGLSSSGTKTELSGNIIKPNIVEQMITEFSAPEYVNSISSTETTVNGQYSDSDGNKLDSIEGASNYSVTTNTEVTTFEPGYAGELPESGTVTATSSTTTYSITGGSGIDKYGGKQLTNAKTTNSEPTMSSINFDDASSAQQEAVKASVSSNFKAGAESIFTTLQNIEKAIPTPEAKKPN